MPSAVKWGFLATRVSGACLAALLVLSIRPPVAEPAASIPSWLPQHFGIGLGAAPSSTGIYGWMPNSGIPWDYAYQYLSGGVNTNAGWETWNANGQFALYYAQGAASHHYLPVFPYYELRQSNGTCSGCGENQVDISNLNNASLMNAYYQNFTILMKRLGSATTDGIAGFGGTAIVDVEPDLSGYVEQAALGTCFGYCTGTGNNPSLVKAMVKSSGESDVAAYPDTYAGFNQALLHLRDEYAPNVKLAFHVSTWATGTDVGQSTDSSINATTLGQEAGSFAASSGVVTSAQGTSTYDLLFNDVLDRDAGQYQALYGANRWWDRLNVTYPNFHRWEQYMSAASGSAGGKPVIVWQVPIGNQYFDTENNSNGHYQDNRAEYIFGHISELQQSSIIGALFGPGNGGSTEYYDADGDGVTNPASFCTSAGLSSGQICNNHTSSQSDDDGGYLRMMAQSYYASLSGGATATPTPVTPTSTSTTTPTTPTSTPTPQPTNTPPPATSTPTQAAPTATATAVAATYTLGASASPNPVSAGSKVTITTSVKSSASVHVLVDVEVYNQSGTKVFQQAWDNQGFSAGQTRTFTSNWSIPSGTASGSYSVDIGIFAPGWGTLYAWDGSATTITVH